MEINIEEIQLTFLVSFSSSCPFLSFFGVALVVSSFLLLLFAFFLICAGLLRWYV